MKAGGLSPLWKLSPGGCAAWPAAPGSPPAVSSGPVPPARLSASAYCGSEQATGSLYMPSGDQTKTCEQCDSQMQKCWGLEVWGAHVNHGVGGDSKQGGSLCDLSDLVPHVASDAEPLQFWQRPTWTGSSPRATYYMQHDGNKKLGSITWMGHHIWLWYLHQYGKNGCASNWAALVNWKSLWRILYASVCCPLVVKWQNSYLKKDSKQRVSLRWRNAVKIFAPKSVS